MPAKSSLKQRIRSGEVLTGVSLSLDIDRSRLKTVLSQKPYDFAAVDSQHAAFSEERLVAFCATAEELSVPVQLRIMHTRHAHLIGRYLDLGPSIIMVPEVKEESTVREAVDAFYYPQTGKRSWGGNARWGIRQRAARLDYAPWWNQWGALCLQLESVEAITNARHLAHPQVDLFAFGPNDLSFSLEAHPLFPFRTVDECIRHVAEQLQGSHVRLTTGANTPQERDRYLAMGVTVFTESPSL